MGRDGYKALDTMAPCKLDCSFFVVGCLSLSKGSDTAWNVQNSWMTFVSDVYFQSSIELGSR